MSSTHLSLQTHFVFSTKDRARTISAEWRERLFAYLGGCLKQSGATPLEIGGVEDHVHVIAGLPATLAPAALMRDVKKATSAWIHDEIGFRAFAWQEGYGGFTVSVSNVEAVRAYIRNQEPHHAKRSFQDEYVELLRRHGVSFDEKHLW